MNPDLDSLANRMVWIHDSSALSEVTSLLFVYVCDTDVTFGFERIHVMTGFARFANPDTDSRA